ncbi:ATP-binding protein [Desulfotruncus alcoholivorax]|uniref:ATP-binding protein n=1 Tax=Desulfotruncus alcoholivorax TaxID=265477 RepID=UPI000409779B|nr:ATP-binding protein [Desulfotruncus alcoholivorax]
MKKWPQETVQITIPSILGYEKIVLSAAGEMARNTGFTAERVEDLCTAVQEACINAIEHGNRGIKNAAVLVTITETSTGLQIEVQDYGREHLPTGLGLKQPNLEERIAGTGKKRGWGLYLMRQLVDGLEFRKAGRYNVIRLVIKRS